MSQENIKPDQIQASVAAALSRLRGDLSPPGDAPADAPPTAGAPTTPLQSQRPDPAQPANDLRAEPGFKPIPSGISPQAPGDAQAPAEPEVPRAMFSRPRFVPPSTPEAQPATPTVQRTSGPLARMMNKEAPPPASEPSVAPPQAATAGSEQQPDLLAGLPPPPLGDALSEDTEATPQRRRRNRRILALSLALVAVVGGFWVWSMGRGGSEDVPVITAESTPEKVKPADEGGLQVPNQNVQVLDNMDSSQPAAEGETVLPPPEQPVTPPAPAIEEAQPAPEAEATDSSTATLQDVPSVTAPEPPVVEAPAVEAPTVEAPATTAEATQPAITETAPAAPEQPAPEAAAQPAAPTQEPAAEAAPAQPEPAAAEPAAPVATQEANVAPEPAPAPAAPAATGGSRIQLAAVKSEAAAEKEWAKLQKAYPDLLGSLALTVERVDKGASGIFYRIQAGPLADKGAAKQLCSSLKQRGQDCLVAK